jgi:hypothetical protein
MSAASKSLTQLSVKSAPRRLLNGIKLLQPKFELFRFRCSVRVAVTRPCKRDGLRYLPRRQIKGTNPDGVRFHDIARKGSLSSFV